MKVLQLSKDGGPESRVWGFFFLELKRLFSIVLLVFKGPSRPVFHSHAFHSVSWLLWGGLEEHRLSSSDSDDAGVLFKTYRPSIFPIVTTKRNVHMVNPIGTAVVLSFRGPWVNWWLEWNPFTDEVTTLGDVRIVLHTFKMPPRPWWSLTKQTNEELAS